MAPALDKTPSFEASLGKFKDAASGRKSYPKGSVFVAFGTPGFEESFARYLKEGRSIVLVMSDEVERLIEPVPDNIFDRLKLAFSSKAKRRESRAAIYHS